MAVSSHDVAAALRARIPGLPTKKLHKLLYYCQGHHLATFGEPLFEDTISAWDMGPVVGTLWHAEKQGTLRPVRSDLPEGALNTIGYVVSRYGQLTGLDLEHLTHSETPWQRADAVREPQGRVRIERDWLIEYFQDAGAADSDDAPLIDPDEVARWLHGAVAPSEPPTGDEYEALQARLRQYLHG
jgi:uncharacterized phage-associated protein